MPLPSSFWVDEMVSAFVIHFGPPHPSLAVAPQVTETIYYWLPHAAERLFGFSEVVYRVPSLIVLGIALWLIARLAARLIHPRAAWFAVFACLALKGFDYQADDARPYALGPASPPRASSFWSAGWILRAGAMHCCSPSSRLCCGACTWCSGPRTIEPAWRLILQEEGWALEGCSDSLKTDNRLS